MTGWRGIQRHVLYLSHLSENRRWATNMSIQKLVLHINKSLQKDHHPASSKWPFDSPNGGHLKPPKRTLGRTWIVFLPWGFLQQPSPVFRIRSFRYPTLWGWKSGRFLTAVTFRPDGVEEQVPLFQTGGGVGDMSPQNWSYTWNLAEPQPSLEKR